MCDLTGWLGRNQCALHDFCEREKRWEVERLQRKGIELNVSFRLGYKLDCIQKFWTSRPINKKPLYWKKIITKKSIQNWRTWTFSGSFFKCWWWLLSNGHRALWNISCAVCDELSESNRVSISPLRSSQRMREGRKQSQSIWNSSWGLLRFLWGVRSNEKASVVCVCPPPKPTLQLVSLELWKAKNSVKK